jgi:glutamate synthase domain-containing protein 3
MAMATVKHGKEKGSVNNMTGEIFEIDAKGVHYKELNRIIKDKVWYNGTEKFKLTNVFGQRYIATGVDKPIEIEIFGTPGNDLGAFMDGPTITVHGNAQDGLGNTMNEGTIVIHGHAGDITGYAMRGGSIYIREDVGYRVGIHMKEYINKIPTLVIGGTAQDFLGEYMAGGNLVVLGLTLPGDKAHFAKFIGTGMHGGRLYLRGKYEDHQLGREVSPLEMDTDDEKFLEVVVGNYASFFGKDASEILSGKFTKLLPLSKRPYGKIYAY